MGTCMFAASGLEFRMDEFLASSSFRPQTRYYKGQVPPIDNPAKKPRPDSGFVVVVSSDDKGDDISGQRAEAYRFLQKNEQEIERARTLGADNFLFDFGIAPGQQLQTTIYLPPELIENMARFSMGIVFSVIQVSRG